MTQAHMLLGLHQMYAQSYCKLQSRGSVECANADIKDMTITWLRDNGCQDRHAGIKIVKLKKNRSYHAPIHHISQCNNILLAI